MSTPIRALHTWNSTHTDGTYTFIQNCLSGHYGDVAQFAAQGAITAATEFGDTDDEERIAAFIVETVEDMHRAAALDH